MLRSRSKNHFASISSNPLTTDFTYPHDTVDFDPAGIVDLTADPIFTPLDRVGIWGLGLGINVVFASGGELVEFGIRNKNVRSAVRDISTLDNPPDGGGEGATFGMVENDAPSLVSPVVVQYGAGSPTSVRRSRLYVFWMSD